MTTNPETSNLVEPNFDENVLRMLCDLDVSGFSVRESWRVGTQCFRLISVFRPVATGQNQTEHSVVQGLSSDRSLPFLDANPFLQETSVFFKKRAMLEDEYGRNLQKLARSTSELYAMNEGKAG